MRGRGEGWRWLARAGPPLSGRPSRRKRCRWARRHPSQATRAGLPRPLDDAAAGLRPRVSGRPSPLPAATQLTAWSPAQRRARRSPSPLPAPLAPTRLRTSERPQRGLPGLSTRGPNDGPRGHRTNRGAQQAQGRPGRQCARRLRLFTRRGSERASGQKAPVARGSARLRPASPAPRATPTPALGGGDRRGVGFPAAAPGAWCLLNVLVTPRAKRAGPGCPSVCGAARGPADLTVAADPAVRPLPLREGPPRAPRELAFTTPACFVSSRSSASPFNR